MTAPSVEDPNLPPEETEEDESALVPALLAIYAAYLVWRAANQGRPQVWWELAAVLRIERFIGAQLAMIAGRALDRQVRESGRAGGELWLHIETAGRAGVDAGVQAIAQALIWTDQHATGGPDPLTRDAVDVPGGAGSDAAGFVPTVSDPPDILASMAAAAAANGAVMALAQAAGWRGKIWRSRRDTRVRDTHVALDGVKVPTESPFVSPSGAKLMFPGDPKAPIEERANCRCRLVVSRR